MARNSRRFLLWTESNVTGRARDNAYAEGCLFTDGTVVLVYSGQVPVAVVLPTQGIWAIEGGAGFGGPGSIEWLDGAHS